MCWEIRTSQGVYTQPPPDDEPSPYLLIPLAGPWIALATGDTPDQALDETLAVGIAQAFGLASFITGLAIRVPMPATAEELKVNVVPTSNGVAFGAAF